LRINVWTIYFSKHLKFSGEEDPPKCIRNDFWRQKTSKLGPERLIKRQEGRGVELACHTRCLLVSTTMVPPSGAVLSHLTLGWVSFYVLFLCILCLPLL